MSGIDMLCVMLCGDIFYVVIVKMLDFLVIDIGDGSVIF